MNKWSIYDPQTFVIKEMQFSEQQPPNSTPVMVTTVMAKPVFNPNTNTITEGGTPQEIAAKLESLSIPQPRLRASKSTPLVLTTAWQDIVFDGNSELNTNLFPKNQANINIVNYDAVTNLFKFYDPLAANYRTTLYPRVTASVAGQGTTLQYRLVVPNGGGVGIDSSFPYPDSDGFADMYYVGLKGGQVYRMPVDIPMYLTDKIRINGIKLQMRISEALNGNGVVTLNEIAVLIQQ